MGIYNGVIKLATIFVTKNVGQKHISIENDSWKNR